MDHLDGLLFDSDYLESLYKEFEEDPGSVDPHWREFFKNFRQGKSTPPSPPLSSSVSTPLPLLDSNSTPIGIQVQALIHAFRHFGHLAANLDPLGRSNREHPFLDLKQFGLEANEHGRVVDGTGFQGADNVAIGELIEILKNTYCGSIGVEYMDLVKKEQRDWLQSQMEPICNRPRLETSTQKLLLQSLVDADVFEETLHTMYLGAKRFSLEGGTSLIPLLRGIIAQGAQLGVKQMVLGMAHRGRLNVLANVMNKPLKYILAEFEGRPLAEELQGYGDVKYHLGYSSDFLDPISNNSVHLSMAFNPSHLETVNPVVEGIVRAKQDYHGDQERVGAVPILIHGDAAFAGQGVVAETFTLAKLKGYTTGGTIHIIVNNQVGFTANPEESRSTAYASDTAKIVRCPVFHVNADDPEAVLHTARIAMKYRNYFHRDVVIDLICFRRHGHNELDDASFTQPVMSKLISKHQPGSKIYQTELIEKGVITPEEATSMRKGFKEKMKVARDEGQKMEEQITQSFGGLWVGLNGDEENLEADTKITASVASSVAESIVKAPEGFHWHKRLERLMKQRSESIKTGEALDWGSAEALAFGSMLLEGIPIRLSGQDSGRGTFSHRHGIYHDNETGERYVPLNHIKEGQASIDIINSPLSEEAVLAYEYGYSSANPKHLVIWEAQFGDFVNGAQVVIDQLIASAEYKWGRMSGLVMLLPHGYEGQGPEHSSARLERFLELCAENNLQVVNLTTPAQFFHCLRRQQHRNFRKPLVVMSPKSLLRHPLAKSALADITGNTFEPILDDETADKSKVTRVLFCSGKIYYSLFEKRAKDKRDDIAIVRLEQLYPYLLDSAKAIMNSYPALKNLVWVQEEPRNMGAWRHLLHRFEATCPQGVDLEYVGRDSRAVPATGVGDVHKKEEIALVNAAFADDSNMHDVAVIKRHNTSQDA